MVSIIKLVLRNAALLRMDLVPTSIFITSSIRNQVQRQFNQAVGSVARLARAEKVACICACSSAVVTAIPTPRSAIAVASAYHSLTL